MERAKYLYHVTDRKNLKSIFQYGLRREHGGKHAFAIYLSTNPLSWWCKEEDALLQIDIEDLENLRMTTFLPELDEVLVWGDVPPFTKSGERRIRIVESFIKTEDGNVTVFCSDSMYDLEEKEYG